MFCERLRIRSFLITFSAFTKLKRLQNRNNMINDNDMLIIVEVLLIIFLPVIKNNSFTFIEYYLMFSHWPFGCMQENAIVRCASIFYLLAYSSFPASIMQCGTVLLTKSDHCHAFGPSNWVEWAKQNLFLKLCVLKF